VYDCVIYILYYILAYIQYDGDVSLENWQAELFVTCIRDVSG